MIHDESLLKTFLAVLAYAPEETRLESGTDCY